MSWLQFVVVEGLCLTLQACLVKSQLFQTFCCHWLTTLSVVPVTTCFLVEFLRFLIGKGTLHTVGSSDDHGRNVRVGIGAVDVITVLRYVR